MGSSERKVQTKTSLNYKASKTAVWCRNVSEAAAKIAAMTLAGMKLTLAQSS